MTSSRIPPLLLLTAAALQGCAASSVTPGSPQGVALVLQPLSAQVAPAETVPFEASVTGTADTAVVWSVQEGPPGGSVTSSGLYTAPATEGTFHVVATAHADTSISQAATVTVTAPAGLSVATAELPGGTAGSPYSATLAAAGGTPPYTWAVVAGTLPPGLSLAPSTGAISGSPTTAGTSGLTVQVSDSASRTAAAALAIAISPAGAIDQSILPAIFQTRWDPGIPGGIPGDGDPVRPATVWLPSGNPYGGYSV
ncbi:MAG TPA: putative Ig domain-containing protein, partial [Frankiaceae bacterium]|nr:putative Ig domain-containing protein [Frankiaceae bacterium]